MATKKTEKPSVSKFQKALEAHREELREAGCTLSDKQLEVIAKVIHASA
jgi:glucuronate isomerase